MPMIRWLAKVATRFTPKHRIEALRQDLAEAGSPSAIGPAEDMGVRLLGGPDSGVSSSC
jgi:hypothetical protein